MTDKKALQSTILHLIKPEDLNHHGTLFAGQMAKWLIEAGLMTVARLVGNAEDVVCVRVNGLTFKKPLNNGDLIDVRTRIARFGLTSITVYSEAWRNQDTVPVVTNIATYVTVNKQNKPYRHGLVLTEDYIAANREIYDMAANNRGEK